MNDFTKVVNGKRVPDDYCDACGKKVADIECGHGIMCLECYAQAHGSEEAVCSAL